MSLADFIADNKDRLIRRWHELVVERLSIQLEASELRNALPEFIDDVVVALRAPGKEWVAMESAQAHGRQRMHAGINMGALSEEMALITEVVCELHDQDDRRLAASDVGELARVIGRGTASSITAYAAMRDSQVARLTGEHFSFIAHELRTPLQTARIVASLLPDASENARPAYLSKLQRALSQVSEQVDRALMQARLTVRPPMTVEACAALPIVDAARENVIDYAQARRISLSVEAPEDFTIDADARLLRSALTNLLKNAVKFSHEGSSITIRASAQDGRALFEVEDQCGGMPDDLPSRLFQPFTQGGSDRTGFGLGLMIVKQAAEAHGGACRVTNRPGDGCTFTIEMPLRQGSTE